MTLLSEVPPAWLLLPSAHMGNVLFTFWGALAIAVVAARVAPSPTLAKWALLSPIAKLGLDAAAGIPAGAYALSGFAGSRWDLGRFQLGVGYQLQELAPSLTLHLSALKADRWYRLSVGDGLAHAIYYRGGAWVLLLVVLAAVVVAGIKVARRLWVWRQQGRILQGRFGPAEHGLTLGRIRLRRCLARGQGAFTTGIFRPVLWLPRAGEGLSHAEQAAVLRHELAHVRAGDVPLFALLGLATDLLWFVPGIHWLQRQVHAHAERAADHWAVAQGADPHALARALLHTAQDRLAAKQLAGQDGAFGPALRAGKPNASEVSVRVRALLQPPARRTATGRSVALALASLALLLATMNSSFFGYR